MRTKTLLLVRHPESFKNVADQHGGPGASLTARGLSECREIAAYVRNRWPDRSKMVLIGHRVAHVSEATLLIGENLGIWPTWDERLRGLDLGVLSGLSRAEAHVRFPGAACRLQEWRDGTRRIDRLILPGAESVDSFRTRIHSLVRDWTTSAGSEKIIAVCTRSVLIMFRNCAELGINFDYARYKTYEFSGASITEMVLSDELQYLQTIEIHRGEIGDSKL